MSNDLLFEVGGGVSLDRYGTGHAQWHLVERVTEQHVVVNGWPDLPMVTCHLPKEDIHQSISAAEWERFDKRGSGSGVIIQLLAGERVMRCYEVMHADRQEDFAAAVAAVRGAATIHPVICLPEHHNHPNDGNGYPIMALQVPNGWRINWRETKEGELVAIPTEVTR